MEKKIRPLAHYKKQHPELYGLYSGCILSFGSQSTKGKENEFYWNYFLFNNSICKADDNNAFFWNAAGTQTNIGTITELGRLHLTGWYYNIEEWCDNIGVMVYNSYVKKKERGETFNDSEFKDAILHIRENIKYYYNNDSELKLYVLDKFFKDELKPLLPEPPKELKEHEDACELLALIHTNRLKKDKNWYIKNYNLLDEYTNYLIDIIDGKSIERLTLKEFEAEQNATNKEYFNRINQLRSGYKNELKNINIKSLAR